MGNTYPSVASGQSDATTNEWGPTTLLSDFSYPAVVGDGVPGSVPSVPNSPDGASLVPRQFDEGWNYENSKTSTEAVLQDALVVESSQQCTNSYSTLTAQQVVAGVGAPTSTTCVLPINAWFTGYVPTNTSGYGSKGTKFS